MLLWVAPCSEQARRSRRREGGARTWRVEGPPLLPLSNLKPWATQPLNSVRPWWVATRAWPGSYTKEIHSSGKAWTQMHLTESSTSTTRHYTTSAATQWRVCSGRQRSCKFGFQLKMNKAFFQPGEVVILFTSTGCTPSVTYKNFLPLVLTV